jgi:hypothetical protein
MSKHQRSDTPKQQAHNRAQDLGSRANLADKIAHQIERPFRSKHYKEGFDHGTKNPKR